MDLLARREHSERELQAKLAARGFAPEAVGEVLADLKSAGMQDDARFAEAYARSRVAKGYGPLRISRELGERGLGDELVRQVFTAMDLDWEERYPGGAAEEIRPAGAHGFQGAGKTITFSAVSRFYLRTNP